MNPNRNPHPAAGRATRFTDRRDAGGQLAEALTELRGPGTVVLGLPRGGVPVAEEVAVRLGAPLDVCLVRKLGVPFDPELALGAIGEDGIRVLNEDVLGVARLGPDALAGLESRERAVLQRRVRVYRRARDRVDVAGRRVVLVDDGIATGATARAACQVVRARGASGVVVAAPVGPPDVTARLGPAADACVCLATPPGFAAIGGFYADFSQTDDAEVLACLARAQARSSEPTGSSGPAAPSGATRSDRPTGPDGSAGPAHGLPGRPRH